MPIPFRKMHAHGDDFVVVDRRGQDDPITPDVLDHAVEVVCDGGAVSFQELWSLSTNAQRGSAASKAR
jgi:diaminopimelate epimerase